jgi:hypothetical protein
MRIPWWSATCVRPLTFLLLHFQLDVMPCKEEDDVMAILEEGLLRRTTAAHEMNERSSRSHAILTVYIERRGGSGFDADDPIAPKVQGAVNFVVS